MKVTIQKSIESKGMISKTNHYVLSLWLDLTDQEKSAIEKSGLSMNLLWVEKDINNELQYVGLDQYMNDSGPRQVSFSNIFLADAAGKEFKENVQAVASAIKSFQSGELTQDESCLTSAPMEQNRLIA